MANVNRTKVITGKNTRLSYFHGWEPVSINGGAEKYSVSVLIPKDDIETINAINAAVDAAIEEGVAKFGGKKPNKGAIKLPLRDGDVERDDDAYKDHYFVNANPCLRLLLGSCVLRVLGVELVVFPVLTSVSALLGDQHFPGLT